MDQSTDNVPAKIHADAKEKALKVIEACKGYAMPFKLEDLETQPLFLPVVTPIKPLKEDFHDTTDMGILPKVPLQSLLLRENGIEVLRTDNTTRGEDIFISHVFGQRRMPDGTMQPADASYEFNCKVRAEMDFIKDSRKQKDKQKYASETDKRFHLLDLINKGARLAETGAHWRLTRRLGCVPASFKTAEELMRGLLALRIERDNKSMISLATENPAIGAQLIRDAAGASTAIFGPQKQIPRTVDVESGEMIQQPAAEEGQGDMFPELEPAAAAQPELSPQDKLKETLKGYLPEIPEQLAVKAGNVRQLIDGLLKDPKATVDNLNSWIDRCLQYVQAKKERAS